MNLKELLEKLDKEDLYKFLEHRQNLKDRNIEYLENLGPFGRINLLKKIQKKYESEEYQIREYKLGYEPRCPLYDCFLDYADKYGEDIFNEDEYFLEDKYFVDDSWIISLYVGQGSFIRIEWIDTSKN